MGSCGVVESLLEVFLRKLILGRNLELGVASLEENFESRLDSADSGAFQWGLILATRACGRRGNIHLFVGVVVVVVRGCFLLLLLLVD